MASVQETPTRENEAATDARRQVLAGQLQAIDATLQALERQYAAQRAQLLELRTRIQQVLQEP